MHHVGITVDATGRLTAHLAAPLVGDGAPLQTAVLEWWVADAPDRTAPMAEQVAARAGSLAAHRLDDRALDVVARAVLAREPVVVPVDRSTARRVALGRLETLGN